MKELKYYAIAGIIFVILTGSLAHFLYDWSGNNYIIGLFTPVNESVWEHMKLLFFPMLLYSLIMAFRFQKDFPCIISALCWGILSGTWTIPVLFYAYKALLGKDLFIMDIGIFILSILLAFWLSYKLSLSCRTKRYTPLPCSLLCILFLCFLLFTYHPPSGKIFDNPIPHTNTMDRLPISFGQK